MILTSLSLLCTIAVLNLHHHSPNKPVPKILRFSILKILARCVCLYKEENHSATNNSIQPLNQSFVDKKIKQEIKQRQIILQDVDEFSDRKLRLNENENNAGAIPADILVFLRKKIRDDEEKDRLSHNKDEWEHAANVLDRFFLVFYFVGISALSLGYLLAIRAEE